MGSFLGFSDFMIEELADEGLILLRKEGFRLLTKDEFLMEIGLCVVSTFIVLINLGVMASANFS